MTHKEFIRKATESLSLIYSMGEAKALSIRILVHYLKITEYEYLIEPNLIIPKSHLDILNSVLEELQNHKPIQYILGYEDFAGHRFHVNESVLIPRPETEELVRIITNDWEASKYSDLRILDMCTGSGCIAYTLAQFFPKSEIYACDIEDDALKVARNQIEFNTKLKINTPIFHKWDILSGIPNSKERMEIEDILPENLDILVSNPPYVCENEKEFMSENVLNYEPHTALFVPEKDPLKYYKALCDWAAELLKVGGQDYFEINEAYPKEITDLIESYGFSDLRILEDFNSKPRFACFTKWF